MFNKLRIRTKIIIVLSSVAIIAVGINGYVGYDTAAAALKAETFNKLTAVREMKANQIEDYFEQVTSQLQAFSDNPRLVSAMIEFKKAFNSVNTESGLDGAGLDAVDMRLRAYYQDDYLNKLSKNLDQDPSMADYWPESPRTRILQDLFIVSEGNTPRSVGPAVEGDQVADYVKTHEFYHPLISRYLDELKHYDLFLVDHETGDIVYTVDKEADYGTSLLTGPYRKSNLADVFRAVQKAPGKDTVVLVDFNPYHPSLNAYTSFIASPIFDDAQQVGVVIYQLPVNRLNDIMTSKQQWASVGRGQSGEAYIVGQDYTLRNQSRFLIEDRDDYFKMIRESGVPEDIIRNIGRFDSSIGLQVVRTKGTEAAIRGESGTQIFPDYRGVPVLSSYKPLDIPDVNWVIMSEIDQAEAFEPVYGLRTRLLYLLAGLIVAIMAVAISFSRTLTRPLHDLQENAKQLAQGNMSVDIETGGSDEIGDLARSFAVMQASIQRLVKDLRANSEQLEDRVAERTVELEKANERSQLLLESTREGIFGVDRDGVVTFVNASSTRMLGFDREEMLGKAVHALVHHSRKDGKPYPLEECPMHLAYTEGAARTIDDEVLWRKDGSSFDVEYTSMPIRQDDAIIGAVVVFRDITERKRAEADLLQSENRLDNAARSAGLGLWDFYPQAGDIFANDIWATLLGYESGYLLETNEKWARVKNGLEMWVELLHPDDLAPVQTLVQDHLEGRTEVYRAEYRMKCKDGRWKWILDVGQVVARDSEGNALRMCGVNIDVDEIKQLQLELARAKEVAEAATRAKSDFLANMSHELRTPMNAIIGYSEMLIEEAEDLEQEESVPDLKRIHGAGKHLLALINDILDLSKIEAGKMELFIETFDIEQMLDEIKSTVDTLVKKKNNRFELNATSPQLEMTSDLTKVRQSLFNLISNAAKFTENGVVTLSANRTSVEGLDWIEFCVSDTGIGIAEDKLGILFDEFTQADDSTTRNYGGTGLGLAITKRFCEMMGGQISVESHLGEGSQFTICLPCVLSSSGGTKDLSESPIANADASPVTHASAPDQAGHSNLILVIDDDPNTLDMMTKFLNKEKYQVVTASSGEEGLRLAKTLLPAAITLDVLMPRVDGWKVIKALKADPDTRDIPVIMLTMVSDKSMGLSLGAMEFLNKPIDREQLLRILPQCCPGKSEKPILIVEDDQTMREMLCRILTKEGCLVREAPNGKVALDQVRLEVPGIILLDLLMPVMDGFAFLRELRDQEAWRDIPVLVITSKDITPQEKQLLEEKVVTIFQKGAYTREALLDQVRSAIRLYVPKEGQ